MAANPSQSAVPVIPPSTPRTVSPAARLDRRRFLQVAGVAGAAAGLSSITAGCATSTTTAGTKPVRIGLVSNQTGALSGFGEADSVVIANIRNALKDSIDINGTTYPLQIQLRDTGSQPQRSAQVASDLIASGVDLLLTAGAPEIVNPVSNVAEKAGTPCLSTNVPWQAWFFGRQTPGKPPQQFNWTYHFFWGLEDVEAAFSGIWSQVTNNKVLAAVFSKDPDGDAWANKDTGLPFAFGKRGYTFIQEPRPEDGANSYKTLIQKFKDSGAQILTGVISAPDFATLWRETNDMGFRPPIATIGKALLFPAYLEVLQPSPAGLTGTVSWHPTWPFKSSLTGLTSAQWAAEYTRQTHRQWTQPIGSVHALFEVAISALQRAGVGDPQAIVDAIQHTSMDTILGHVSWAKGHDKLLPPIAQKNVSKTPLNGGQWINTSPGSRFPFEQVIVANPNHPTIPVARSAQALAPQSSWSRAQPPAPLPPPPPFPLPLASPT